MGYHSAVVGVLALAALASASVGDNSLDSGERVVVVSPVLAPSQDSKAQSTVRARQFPILVLLAQSNPEYSREQQAISLERNQQPIHVQKLEDQGPPAPSAGKLSRQRRHLHKKHFSKGGGGCYSCQQQQPVYRQQPVYVQPVYVQQPVYRQPVYRQPVYQHASQQHYSPCGGGCGGGGGGGQSYASATATATAHASSYGG